MLSLKLFLIALDIAHVHVLSHAINSETWYHPPDHPVHDLFKRTVTPDKSSSAKHSDFPQVGSTDWYKLFPSAENNTTPDTSQLPKVWVEALNAAVKNHSIPDIPQSNNTVYPNGTDPLSIEVCSGTYKCRIPGDIWDAPNGIFASSFDDGPTPSTPDLVNFLNSNNLTTTHFMIGYNILIHPDQFKSAFLAGHAIAVHTWSHPYLTGLSNLAILSEIGNTMKIIYISTGGRVPKFMRPPFGDTDQRVSAIAKVFGLQMVVWNKDTNDWKIADGTNSTPIETVMEQFLEGPKEPGLIVLEHELTPITLQGFYGAFPSIAKLGWIFASLAEVLTPGNASNPGNSSTTNVLPKPTVSPGSSTSSGFSTTVISKSTVSPGSSTSSGSSTTEVTPKPTVSPGSSTSSKSSTTVISKSSVSPGSSTSSGSSTTVISKSTASVSSGSSTSSGSSITVISKSTVPQGSSTSSGSSTTDTSKSSVILKPTPG